MALVQQAAADDGADDLDGEDDRRDAQRNHEPVPRAGAHRRRV